MNEADLLEAVEIPTTGEIEKGQFSGRGVRDGYGTWNACPEGGDVSISLGCNLNDEFWLQLRLDRATLQAMLDALPAPGPRGWDHV